MITGLNTVDTSNFPNRSYGHAAPGAPGVPEHHGISMCSSFHPPARSLNPALYPVAINSMNHLSSNHFRDWQSSGAIYNTPWGPNPTTSNNSNPNATYGFQGSMNGLGSSWWQGSAIPGDFHQVAYLFISLPRKLLTVPVRISATFKKPIFHLKEQKTGSLILVMMMMEMLMMKEI